MEWGLQKRCSTWGRDVVSAVYMQSESVRGKYMEFSTLLKPNCTSFRNCLNIKVILRYLLSFTSLTSATRYASQRLYSNGDVVSGSQPWGRCWPVTPAETAGTESQLQLGLGSVRETRNADAHTAYYTLYTIRCFFLVNANLHSPTAGRARN